jgi:hypothetical protein
MRVSKVAKSNFTHLLYSQLIPPMAVDLSTISRETLGIKASYFGVIKFQESQKCKETKCFVN